MIKDRKLIHLKYNIAYPRDRQNCQNSNGIIDASMFYMRRNSLVIREKIRYKDEDITFEDKHYSPRLEW